MTKQALSLLLLALASSACAESGKATGIQCGIKLGGASSVYETSFGSKAKSTAGNKRVNAMQRHRSVVFVTPSTATTAKTGSTGRKMPPVIPLAKLGCSWR